MNGIAKTRTSPSLIVWPLLFLSLLWAACGDDPAHSLGTCDIPAAGEPHPVAAEGNSPPVGTLLHLSVVDSNGDLLTTDKVRGFSWSVIAPSASTSRLLPSDGAANPTFAVSTPGEYVFGVSLTMTTDTTIDGGCISVSAQ